MNLESAASMIGLTNSSYLARCERGDSTFPASRLKRAIKLYGIKPETVLEAVVKDYRAGMLKWLGEK